MRSLPGAKAGDWFGQSVATIADLDKDGVEDLLVGAQYADDSVGRVFVVSGRDGSTIRVLQPPTGK